MSGGNFLYGKSHYSGNEYVAQPLISMIQDTAVLPKNPNQALKSYNQFPSKPAANIQVLRIRRKQFGASRSRITYFECDVSIAGQLTLRGIKYMLCGSVIMPKLSWQHDCQFEVTDEVLLKQITEACASAAIEVVE